MTPTSTRSRQRRAPITARQEPRAIPTRALPPTPVRSTVGHDMAAPPGRTAFSRLVERSTALAEAWAPTTARVLLGLVLAWFGYHELVAPGLWTGYVPVLSATAQASKLLVLAHGWVLLVLAVALVAGVAPRVAAMIASLLLVEIVISLSASGGLSDLVLRDVGVLGLSVSVIGAKRPRLLLRR
jgi:uncharacterized membrane protein YphA (DoxX/SURF4 family)